MEIQDNGSLDKAKERMFQTFSEFMIRITKFDELAEVGSRLLVGFQQGLEYMRRPSIAKNSGLVERIIRENETKRLSSYVEAGCLNAHDTLQNMSKLHTCHLGLQDHVNKGKCVVDELACLLKDAEAVVQTMNCCLAQMGERNVDTGTDSSDTAHDEEEGLSVDLLKHEVINIATMMAILYSMVQNDYTMQEKIVSSLNLTSSSGELESYSSMWSLRPYIDDEVMHKAWKLVRR
ncbi:PREDICTED: uncharacterized protein LOC109229702 [Nicotiana attenuata]|uniref:DUF7795 domain-containing protein n=1 Tax=Nicotiana attenuata TaxID=49451 RepID=A0A1J6ILP1_NICAT|nr:PREDICTED: uncharacterized protein LOC109229702 [Nicotiana attenuata]OIT01432.1 hypothetical protein A4A49_00427 [Nicotiana attenuata]